MNTPRKRLENRTPVSRARPKQLTKAQLNIVCGKRSGRARQ